MRCPVCKADNAQGLQCRRCKADLALLFQLEEQRARALEQACGSQRPNGSAALTVGLPLQRT